MLGSHERLEEVMLFVVGKYELQHTYEVDRDGLYALLHYSSADGSRSLRKYSGGWLIVDHKGEEIGWIHKVLVEKEPENELVSVSYKCEECQRTMKKIEITGARWAAQCDSDISDSCDFGAKVIWRSACRKCLGE
jgi:hypothetical protein